MCARRLHNEPPDGCSTTVNDLGQSQAVVASRPRDIRLTTCGLSASAIRQRGRPGLVENPIRSKTSNLGLGSQRGDLLQRRPGAIRTIFERRNALPFAAPAFALPDRAANLAYRRID